MAQSKNEFGVEQGSFRQAQAWLHTWCGLWFSLASVCRFS